MCTTTFKLWEWRRKSSSSSSSSTLQQPAEKLMMCRQISFCRQAGMHAWRFGSFSATLQSSLHECPQLQMQKTGFLAWLQDMLLGLWWFQELLLPLMFLYDFLCAAGSVCFLPLCIAHSSSELVSIYLHILCPGKGIPKEHSQPLATFFSFADSCHRYYSLQNGLQPATINLASSLAHKPFLSQDCRWQAFSQSHWNKRKRRRRRRGCRCYSWSEKRELLRKTSPADPDESILLKSDDGANLPKEEANEHCKKSLELPPPPA